MPNATPTYGAIPVQPDSVNFNWQAYQFSGRTMGVSIPIGTTKVVDVDIFSGAPTGLIYVGAEGYPSQSTLNITMLQTSGKNGSQVQISIEHVADDPDYGGAPILVYSQLGNRTHYYLGFIGD